MRRTTVWTTVALPYLSEVAYLQGLAGLVQAQAVAGPVRVAGERFWQYPQVRSLPTGFSVDRSAAELHVAVPTASGLRVTIAVESPPPLVVGTLMSVVEARSSADDTGQARVALVYRAAILSRLLELVSGHGYTLTAHDYAAGTATLHGPAVDVITIAVTASDSGWLTQLSGHRATLLRSIAGSVGAVFKESEVDIDTPAETTAAAGPDGAAAIAGDQEVPDA